VNCCDLSALSGKELAYNTDRKATGKYLKKRVEEQESA